VLGGKNIAEHCLEHLNMHMFTWGGGILGWKNTDEHCLKYLNMHMFGRDGGMSRQD